MSAVRERASLDTMTYNHGEHNVSWEEDGDQELLDGLPYVNNGAHVGFNQGLSSGGIGLLQTIPKIMQEVSGSFDIMNINDNNEVYMLFLVIRKWWESIVHVTSSIN